ncbi:serine hydrolase domain-containing protein [Rufibacter hautae]|uniref:Beta-lactamase family protein n=1 Tax=Rufibacter hautae TaxID=2595005 RepID=A0A5B6TEH1_9BACT|nr:serine hydrolase domain-containing protein [Rufibacter hautae]KAA3437630.1 beta-lactamase family protein [Rufibacter hautae]
MSTSLQKASPTAWCLPAGSFLRSGLLLLAFGVASLPACTQKAHLVDPQVSNAQSLITQTFFPNLERIEFAANLAADDHLRTGLTPGMSLAVAKDGKVIFERAYGEADVENGILAGPETVYKIGSLTMQFTAAIVMRLVEEGRVSLDDSVTRFLPDYPTQGNQVTIRHLLNHTSGIKSFRIMDEENRQRFRQDLTYGEMVQHFGEQPFDFQPGEAFSENNMAYYLLGEIISRVTGLPYEDYVNTQLLQPLQLNHTAFCNDKRLIPHRALGYEYEEGKLINARYVSMQVAGGAGALCSNLSDLLRWTYLLHSGQVVSPASLRQMISPTRLAGGDSVGYGFGLELDELGGHPQVFHSGSANGFVSALAHYPQDGLTVAVFMNSTIGKPLEVLKTLARAALGLEVHDLPLRYKESSRYQGTYTYRVGHKTRELRVFCEKGQLKAQPLGGKPFRLLYQGNHVFVPEVNEDLRLAFSVENGRVQGLNLHAGRWEVTSATRKS